MNKLNTRVAIPVLVLGLSSCATTKTATVQNTATASPVAKEFASKKQTYSGPRYRIGLLGFGNDTRARNMGKKSTQILQTIISDLGLVVIPLTDTDLKQQEKLAEMQLSGQMQMATKDFTAGANEIDYRLSGTVTSYTETEEGSNMLVAKSKTQIARVTIDYALIDPETNQTVVAKSGMGEYKKESGGVLGLGSRSSGDLSLREEALRDALTKASLEVAKELEKLPFTSKVISVDDNRVVFKAGSFSNLKVGTVFTAYRLGKEIIDSDTGRVLGQHKSKLGQITLESHFNENLSSANMKALDLRVGDLLEAGQLVP